LGSVVQNATLVFMKLVFRKFAPVIVTVSSGLPTLVLGGERALIVGAPVASAFTEKPAGFDTDRGLAAPSAQVSTVTWALAALANRSAVTAAFNVVLLTNVVANRSVPVGVVHTTTLFRQEAHRPSPAKPAPVIVSSNVELPSTALVGEIVMFELAVVVAVGVEVRVSDEPQPAKTIVRSDKQANNLRDMCTPTPVGPS